MFQKLLLLVLLAYVCQACQVEDGVHQLPLKADKTSRATYEEITEYWGFPERIYGRVDTWCTAFMVGEYHLITADHCGHPVEDARVYMGSFQGPYTSPFGQAKTTHMWGPFGGDVRVYTLDRPLGKITGYVRGVYDATKEGMGPENCWGYKGSDNIITKGPAIAGYSGGLKWRKDSDGYIIPVNQIWYSNCSGVKFDQRFNQWLATILFHDEKKRKPSYDTVNIRRGVWNFNKRYELSHETFCSNQDIGISITLCNWGTANTGTLNFDIVVSPCSSTGICNYSSVHNNKIEIASFQDSTGLVSGKCRGFEFQVTDTWSIPSANYGQTFTLAVIPSSSKTDLSAHATYGNIIRYPTNVTINGTGGSCKGNTSVTTDSPYSFPSLPADRPIPSRVRCGDCTGVVAGRVRTVVPKEQARNELVLLYVDRFLDTPALSNGDNAEHYNYIQCMWIPDGWKGQKIVTRPYFRYKFPTDMYTNQSLIYCQVPQTAIVDKLYRVRAKVTSLCRFKPCYKFAAGYQTVKISSTKNSNFSLPKPKIDTVRIERVPATGNFGDAGAWNFIVEEVAVTGRHSTYFKIHREHSTGWAKVVANKESKPHSYIRVNSVDMSQTISGARKEYNLHDNTRYRVRLRHRVYYNGIGDKYSRYSRWKYVTLGAFPPPARPLVKSIERTQTGSDYYVWTVTFTYDGPEVEAFYVIKQQQKPTLEAWSGTNRWGAYLGESGNTYELFLKTSKTWTSEHKIAVCAAGKGGIRCTLPKDVIDWKNT